MATKITGGLNEDKWVFKRRKTSARLCHWQLAMKH